jgi:hypothetical protein
MFVCYSRLYVATGLFKRNNETTPQKRIWVGVGVGTFFFCGWLGAVTWYRSRVMIGSKQNSNFPPKIDAELLLPTRWRGMLYRWQHRDFGWCRNQVVGLKLQDSYLDGCLFRQEASTRNTCASSTSRKHAMSWRQVPKETVGWSTGIRSRERRHVSVSHNSVQVFFLSVVLPFCF